MIELEGHMINPRHVAYIEPITQHGSLPSNVKFYLRVWLVGGTRSVELKYASNEAAEDARGTIVSAVNRT